MMVRLFGIGASDKYCWAPFKKNPMDNQNNQVKPSTGRHIHTQ